MKYLRGAHSHRKPGLFQPILNELQDWGAPAIRNALVWYSGYNSPQMPNLREEMGDLSSISFASSNSTQMDEEGNACKYPRLERSYPIQDHSHVSTRGTYSYQNTDQKTICCGKEIWRQHYKDPRPLLHRIMNPGIMATGGTNYASLAVNSGLQIVSEDFWGQTGDLYSLAETALNLQKTNNGFNPYYPGGSNPMGEDLTNCMTPMIIPLAQKKLTWHNTCNMNAEVTIYDFECKRDNNVAPSTLWSQEYATANENFTSSDITTITTYLRGAVGKGDTNYTISPLTLGEKPHGRGLNQFWRKIATVKATVPPGRTLTYTASLRRHKVTAQELVTVGGTFANTPYTASKNNYMAGWTRCIMVVLHGTQCSSNVPLSSGKGGQYAISTSDAVLTRRSDTQAFWFTQMNAATRKAAFYNSEDPAINSNEPIQANNSYVAIPTGNQTGVNVDTDASVTMSNNGL